MRHIQLAISNLQCAKNEQLAIYNVAAFHSTSPIANISPIANRALHNASNGGLYGAKKDSK